MLYKTAKIRVVYVVYVVYVYHDKYLKKCSYESLQRIREHFLTNAFCIFVWNLFSITFAFDSASLISSWTRPGPKGIAVENTIVVLL